MNGTTLLWYSTTLLWFHTIMCHGSLARYFAIKVPYHYCGTTYYWMVPHYYSIHSNHDVTLVSHDATARTNKKKCGVRVEVRIIRNKTPVNFLNHKP